MIRRKLSNGLLKATAQAQAQSTTLSSSPANAAVAASPIQQQSANLASAVLLGSQRNWKTESVQSLKGELKRRGLSQQANKSTLVARISSAEASALLPPTPTIPKSLAPSRQLSTTPKVFRTAEKAKKPARSSANADPGSAAPGATPAGILAKSTEAPLTETHAGETITSTESVKVFSTRGEAAEPEPVPKENITVAPGLPESKADSGTDLSGFSVKMPRAQEEAEFDQIIPVEPDNFKTRVVEPETESSIEDTTPKVMTVASAATHLSGGPISAIHESTDSHAQDEHEASQSQSQSQSNSTSDKSASAKKSAEDAAAGAGAALAAAANSIAGAGRTLGEFSRSMIPSIGLPKSTGSGSGSSGKKASGDFKPIERGLDSEEKKGAWVLAGIVGLGFLLGGSGSSSKDKKSLKDKAGEAAEKVKGMTGAGGEVKGDEKWAKASGAEVVGHGTRKA